MRLTVYTDSSAGFDVSWRRGDGLATIAEVAKATAYGKIIL